MGNGVLVYVEASLPSTGRGCRRSSAIPATTQASHRCHSLVRALSRVIAVGARVIDGRRTCGVPGYCRHAGGYHSTQVSTAQRHLAQQGWSRGHRSRYALRVRCWLSAAASVLTSGRRAAPDCIDYTLMDEELTGSEQYFCDSCNGKQDARKVLHLTQTPRLLVIHVVRPTHSLLRPASAVPVTSLRIPRSVRPGLQREPRK